MLHGMRGGTVGRLSAFEPLAYGEFAMPSFARLIVLGLFMTVSLPALALEDTPENREREVGRYLKTMPPEEMMADMSNKLAATLPEAQRESFIRMMTKNLDMARVTGAMKEGMVKTFSADELHALADFYSSPVAKSALAKMGNYMAEVMPVLMTELRAAAAKTQQEQNQQK
jgi:hypothetical protein